MIPWRIEAQWCQMRHRSWPTLIRMFSVACSVPRYYLKQPIPIWVININIQKCGWISLTPGLCLNINTFFPRYGYSHVQDKTIGRPSYLEHEDPYTGKTTTLYWDGPQVAPTTVKQPSEIWITSTGTRPHHRMCYKFMRCIPFRPLASVHLATFTYLLHFQYCPELHETIEKQIQINWINKLFHGWLKVNYLSPRDSVIIRIDEVKNTTVLSWILRRI